ncbi:MAG: carboxypeptidase regulatory-like domain-containing protein, partial [Candidatus Electrothrix sp. AUS4]|nr:carboxypeptidase regulatory-like domain-containing protein [Candidatus Electrothrix sp. AUS4]
WYNNKSSIDNADPIIISALNEAVSGIDAVLKLDVNGIISGTITDETGNALPHVLVSIYQSNGLVTQTLTDSNGDYMFTELPENSYWLEFIGTEGYISEWYNNKSSIDNADPIMISASNENVNGIDAVLQLKINIVPVIQLLLL